MKAVCWWPENLDVWRHLKLFARTEIDEEHETMRLSIMVAVTFSNMLFCYFHFVILLFYYNFLDNFPHILEPSLTGM